MKINQLITPTEVWCFYFKKIHTLDEVEINVLEQTHPFIKPAVEELKKFHFSVEEQQDYMLYRMNNDTANTIQELIEDTKRDIAKKMLAEGVSKDVIFRVTGLNLKEEDFK